jgi:hypothetical protein
VSFFDNSIHFSFNLNNFIKFSLEYINIFFLKKRKANLLVFFNLITFSILCGSVDNN